MRERFVRIRYYGLGPADIARGNLVRCCELLGGASPAEAAAADSSVGADWQARAGSADGQGSDSLSDMRAGLFTAGGGTGSRLHSLLVGEVTPHVTLPQRPAALLLSARL